MRVVFAGTPEFARVALAQLHSTGHAISLVLTQPDRPAGRGLKLQPSAVKQWSADYGIPVAQPKSLRLDGKYPEDATAARAALVAANPDVLVVAAYGLMLPQWVLELPRLGCLNIHASLLPRWRGAAPIHRAIEAGDTDTGVTIMQMDIGLDTGDMLLVEKVAIEATDTTGTLHDRLAALGGKMVVRALNIASAGQLQPVQQPDEGVNYAHKIDKLDAAIDWAQPATSIERKIRAMAPFPGASTQLGSEMLKLWRSDIDSYKRPPDVRDGHILSANSDGIRVACGEGVLVLTELQRAGGKRLAAGDFLRGFALVPGMLLGK